MALHPWWPTATPLHPHTIFELLAYTAGFQTFLALRRRQNDTITSVEKRGWLLVATIVGAALGAKALFWLEDPAWTWANRTNIPALMTGRTVVGGFLGGWCAVEWAKKQLQITASTGDVLVLPLSVGLFLGRLGCFFSGVEDATHGIPTTLPWGMDLGDGLLRHPTALYELLFLLVLCPLSLYPSANGRKFLTWIGGYLLFRFVSEFLKIQPFPYLGLSAIQCACLLGLAAVVYRWKR